MNSLLNDSTKEYYEGLKMDEDEKGKGKGKGKKKNISMKIKSPIGILVAAIILLLVGIIGYSAFFVERSINFI